jgi:hypothetical protein
MIKRKINPIDILGTFFACPYCGTPKEEWHACCREIGQGELAYILLDGSIEFVSEVIVLQ